MKEYVKAFFVRGAVGMLIGLSIGYTVILFITVTQGELVMTSKTIAFNYVMAVIVGFYMAGVSVVYDVEEWSILRQTVTHGILLLPYIPVAFVIGWAPPGLGGRILFVLMYIGVYAVIWMSFKAYWKKRIRELNLELARLEEKK